jgi:hypothetical protein
MKSRSEMIEELIENELEVNYSDPTYIREVLLTGLKGYESFTDAEIQTYWDEIQY